MVAGLLSGFGGMIFGALITFVFHKEMERKRVFREIATQFSKDWSETFQLMSCIRNINDTESAQAFLQDHESSLFYIAYRLEIFALLVDRQEIDVKLSNHLGLIAFSIEFWGYLVRLNSLLRPTKLDLNLKYFPFLQTLATRFHI